VHGEVERAVVAKQCKVSFVQMVKTLNDLDERGILSRRFVKGARVVKSVYSAGSLFEPFKEFLQQGNEGIRNFVGLTCR
jgi:DNA-binding GntR family transcriptional regulator